MFCSVGPPPVTCRKPSNWCATGQPKLVDGVNYSQPIEHLRDMVNIIRGLLQGEVVSHQGKAITVSGASLGDARPQKAAPIYIAALGPPLMILTISLMGISVR